MFGHYTTGPAEATVAEHSIARRGIQETDPDPSSRASETAVSV
jgi:hypothetical protein